LSKHDRHRAVRRGRRGAGDAETVQERRMAETANVKTDIEAIGDDIASLKRDLAALAEHVKRGAVSGATGAAAQLSSEASDIYDRLASESANSAKALSRQIEEQPLTSLLIAFALGFVGSRLLPR
jgi:ElaB/YqjD/DUF883 family membrane-anchored ribosome-binding protein